jgi:hypothetical protein
MAKADTKEAQAEALARARLVCAAYRRVLGRDGARTPEQQIVWDDMQARGYVRRSTIAQHTPGRVDPLLMAQAEGCRIYHLQTQEFIARASESDEPTQPPKARTE